MNQIKSFFKRFKEINAKYNDISRFREKSQYKDNSVIYAVTAIASLILSIFNLVDGYTEMLFLTTFLAVGLGIAAILSRTLKNSFISDIMAATLGGIVFSYFALTGQNEGFAILWILVLPPIMTSINRTVGIYFSIYILVFVFVICYSPVKNLIVDYYTPTFLERFPTLYTLDFLITLYTWFSSNNAEKELVNNRYVDELTGVYNRAFYNLVCEHIEKENKKDNIILVSMDINGLKPTNDKYGHDAGDRLIIGAANIISKVSDKALAVCRIGGDEFVSVVECDKEEIQAMEKRFIELQNNWKDEVVDSISVSYGIACCADYPGKTLEDIYRIADGKMYAYKTQYYQENNIERRHMIRRADDKK